MSFFFRSPRRVTARAATSPLAPKQPSSAAQPIPILSYPISEPERLISVTVIPTRLPPSLPFSSPQYKLLRSRQLSLRVDSLFSSQPVEKACLPPVVSSLSLSRSLFLSLRFLSAGGPLRLPGLVNDQRVLLLSILLLPATLPRSGQQNK